MTEPNLCKHGKVGPFCGRCRHERDQEHAKSIKRAQMVREAVIRAVGHLYTEDADRYAALPDHIFGRDVLRYSLAAVNAFLEWEDQGAKKDLS